MTFAIIAIILGILLLGLCLDKRRKFTKERERVDKIMAELPIEKVLEHLQIANHPRGKNFIVDECPYCGEKSVMYASPKGVCRCFRCGTSVSVVALVMYMKGVSYEEALTLMESWK